MNLLNIFKHKKGRGFEVLPEFDRHFEWASIKTPTRATAESAGYDICSIEDYVIAPGTKAIIQTGLTAFMGKDEWLALFVRSGLAYNHNLTLQNATGVIDSDFYGKHILILLRNEGTEPFYVNRGDRIAQGVFLPYLKATSESAVKPEKKPVRVGGFGSTGVKAA